MHLVDVGRAGERLLLAEDGLEILDARAGDRRLVLERRRGLLGGAFQGAIILGDLRLQRLDPWMARQQRTSLERELPLILHALLGDAADRIVVDHIGHVDGLAAAQQLADHLRLGLRVGLRGAGLREIGVDVGQLLAGDRHVVGAGEQARLQSILLARVIRLDEPDAQVRDLRAERFRRLLRGQVLGRGLRLQVERGDGVGGTRGELGITAREFDRDDACLRRRIHGELVEKCRDDAGIARLLRRVAHDAEQHEDALDGVHPVRVRIELVIAFETELLDGAPRDVARGHQLHLARDRLGIELKLLVGLLRADTIGAREEGLLVLEQNLRLRRVARRDQIDGDRDKETGEERCRDEKPRPAAQGDAERAEIDFSSRLDRFRSGREISRHDSSCKNSFRKKTTLKLLRG